MAMVIFSPPSSVSRGAIEGELYRSFAESITFGRFISELQWENCSYLEEVRKLVKPGFVVDKIAFFEACYQERAAAKAVADAKLDSIPKKKKPLAEDSDSGIETMVEIGKEGSNKDPSVDKQQKSLGNSKNESVFVDKKQKPLGNRESSKRGFLRRTYNMLKKNSSKYLSKFIIF